MYWLYMHWLPSTFACKCDVHHIFSYRVYHFYSSKVGRKNIFCKKSFDSISSVINNDWSLTVRSLFLRNGFWQISPQWDVKISIWWHAAKIHNSVLSSSRAICRKRFRKISEQTVGQLQGVGSRTFNFDNSIFHFIHILEEAIRMQPTSFKKWK